MAEPDDLPPLEDFSSVLDKLAHLNRKTTPPVAPDAGTIPQVLKEETPKKTTFGGLKKGFLMKKAPESTSEVGASKSRDDPVITSDPSKQGASFQLSEMKKSVDESVQESAPTALLPENWVTDELLDKVQGNPLFAQAFEHPDFSQVLTRFTQNPKQAIREFGDAPEFRVFLQEMCSLLGHHFTGLAGEGGYVGDVEGADQLDEEDKKMQEILNRDEVKEVMRDERIRRMIMDMRDNPERAQDTFRVASPELKKKISILVKHNIVGIQQ